jgi:hypothetical protein
MPGIQMAADEHKLLSGIGTGDFCNDVIYFHMLANAVGEAKLHLDWAAVEQAAQQERVFSPLHCPRATGRGSHC